MLPINELTDLSIRLLVISIRQQAQITEQDDQLIHPKETNKRRHRSFHCSPFLIGLYSALQQFVKIVQSVGKALFKAHIQDRLQIFRTIEIDLYSNFSSLTFLIE